ncbi:MAG: hypothetical protein HGA90_01205, partial [Alphaproteobacteria bacterium]|nr:hypothetical protein [Alphaproteobacteria bacterium]
APLFGPDSRAEVPIVGTLGEHVVSGQIDRLCLHENEVWIVDYKTNRPPPIQAADIPALYRRQLAAYKGVLEKVYPGKTIRCFLLWTFGPNLMDVPETFLSWT